MFNALKYTKRLEEVGLTREQAEAHVLIMTEIIETNLATKQDLKDLESRLIIKVGSMAAASTTLTIAAMTVLLKLV